MVTTSCLPSILAQPTNVGIMSSLLTVSSSHICSGAIGCKYHVALVRIVANALCNLLLPLFLSSQYVDYPKIVMNTTDDEQEP